MIDKAIGKLTAWNALTKKKNCWNAKNIAPADRMTLVKSVLTSQWPIHLSPDSTWCPQKVLEDIDSKRTFLLDIGPFFLCFLVKSSLVGDTKRQKNGQAIRRTGNNLFFPFLSFWSPEYVIVFTYMGAKEQVRYNDAGTPSTSTQLRCSCKAVETLPSARLFQDQITVSWSHIISRFFGSQGRGALSLNCQILYDLSAWIAKYIVGDTDGTFVIADTGLEIW